MSFDWAHHYEGLCFLIAGVFFALAVIIGAKTR
jgi:hypothetical protein